GLSPPKLAPVRIEPKTLRGAYSKGPSQHYSTNPKCITVKSKVVSNQDRTPHERGRSVMQTFEKGVKIGARILANHSRQRKRNATCSNGSVTTIPMVVIFIVEVPFPKKSQITFGNIKM
ncbi:hypothetical protein L195_g046261, partial [Trifolium pratense]